MRFFIFLLFLLPNLVFAQPGAPDTLVYSHWPTVQQQPFDTAQLARNTRRLLDQILPLPAPNTIWRPELMGIPTGKAIDTWIINAEKDWSNGAYPEAKGIIATLERQNRGDAHQRLRLRCLPAFLHLNIYEVAEAEALYTQIATPGNRAVGELQLLDAFIRFRRKEFEIAFKTANTALETAQKTKDRELEMRAGELLGRIARDVFMGASLKAIPFHEAALAIAQERGDTIHILMNLMGLADNYGQAGQNSLYVRYLEQMLNYLGACPLLDMRARTTALIACFERNPASAAQLFEKALRVAHHLGVRNLEQHYYMQLFFCYLHPASVERAAALLDSARLSGMSLEEHEIEECYYQIEKLRGHTELAFGHLEKAYQGVGQAYMKRSGEQLAEWETRLRTRETELQLEQQKRQGWLFIALTLAFGGLFAGAAFAYWNQKKARRKIAAQNALIAKQSAELLRLDEAKSRFFANVSHELRTPLTLLLGPLGSMLQGQRLGSRDHAMAKTARDHARQLLNLVNEILDLSKMESGKLKLQETTVSLQPFLRRVVSAFESHAERLGIALVFEYRVQERLRLLLDEDKIQKVLNNLLANALKFTPPNAGASVQVRVEEAGNCICLEVQDTGRGIHPDDLPHVFDRFFQTNQSDMPMEGGTGIGLALCREFADLMHGRIRVESILGKGSRFFFEFPKKEVLGVNEISPGLGLGSISDAASASLSMEERTDENTGIPQAASGIPQAIRETILLVEDNDSLRDYVKLILSEKYQVISAENGQVALQLLHEQPVEVNPLSPGARHSLSGVNLIISDVMMPVMDGFQFVEKLKSDNRWRHLPVVMLTARADLRDKLKALRIGVDDYLLKPFEETELLARVENLLKNAHARSEAQQELAQTMQTDNQEQVASSGHKQFTALHKPAVKSAGVTGLDNGLNEPGDLVQPHKQQLSQEELDWLATLEQTVERETANSRFNAEALAEAMLMSRTKLFQHVKQLTGMTPNEYVLEVRFRTARTLLETRRVSSVKSVAGSVGFRDVEYFSKQFRSRYGKMPSEYLN